MTTIERPKPSDHSRYLLVEDDDIHADLFLYSAKTLAGNPVDRARNLNDGLQMFEEINPQVVILDLGLPESDGLETLALFLEVHPTAPVIVLTSISDLSLGERALQMGAMDFLSKDEINGRTLARSIRYSVERWTQKQKVDATLADLEYFGNTAAHDLISPLNAIQGFAHLIEIGLRESQVDNEVHECLDLLKTSCKRAAKLVSDLHKFARLGQSGVVRENFELATLIRETTTSLSTAIEEVSGEVRYSQLPNLNGDRGLIAHVLQNLIGNALKYGRPDIAPLITIDSIRRDGRVIVRVCDNGKGIPESGFSRVFLPFERLDSGTQSSGSGLGLSICKRIIDAHGGKIWIEPTTPDGVAFLFHLGEETYVNDELRLKS